MDLTKIAELLGTKTEGDPAFQQTEEAQFFVEMLRMDDVDRRASIATDPTSEGEGAEVASELLEDDEFSQAEEVVSADDTVTGPVADAEGSVAPEAQPLQALLSEGEDATASDAVQEDGPEPEPPAEWLQEDDPLPAEVSDVQVSDSEPPEPPEILQETGEEAAPNQALRDEQALVTEIPSDSGVTTTIVPEKLMANGFEDVMQVFERNVRVPDIQLGEPWGPPLEYGGQEDPDHGEQMVSTTEHAEAMMSSLTTRLLEWERRT